MSAKKTRHVFVRHLDSRSNRLTYFCGGVEHEVKVRTIFETNRIDRHQPQFETPPSTQCSGQKCTQKIRGDGIFESFMNADPVFKVRKLNLHS